MILQFSYIAEMQIFGFHFGNVKPISMSNLYILLKRCWSCISLLCMCRDQCIIKKSSTYRELLTPWTRDLNMELIFGQNMVAELMLPRENLFLGFDVLAAYSYTGLKPYVFYIQFMQVLSKKKSTV